MSENQTPKQAKETVADGENLDETKMLQQKISTLELEIEKHRNETLYLRAEFDTYKRNAIKERSELLKYGAERFITELLGVLDNFERALDVHSPEQFQVLKKGVEMTAAEIKTLLTKFGVQEIQCQGVPFDPMIHEALGQEPTDQTLSGHVHRVFRKPYKMIDKTIRTGQVIVASSPDTPHGNAKVNN